MAALTELNVNRESSLKHHVRSNVKPKTKENAPRQTVAQVKDYRECHHGRLNVYSRNLLLSQSDYCGKSAPFQRS